jgi:hypothetical protein
MALGSFSVERAVGIDTREELLLALGIAAELEHSLLVQYLFAGYSLRKRPGDGIDERQVELVRDWGAALLAVAREEMVHFATVTKIAVAIGGAPQLNRPTFPQPAGTAFPFELRLRRFGTDEIARFVRFETPAEAVTRDARGLVAPDVPEYEYLGQLYTQIKDAISLLAARHGDEWLLVGPEELREAEDWGLHHVVRGIDSADAAMTSIQEVIDEGEGGEVDVEDSHWQRFLLIEQALTEELDADPRFEPAHPVVDNPVTRAHPGGTLLHGEAADVAELFNHLYASVLLILGQYYAPAGESAEQREELQATARRSMSAILRPVAEVLAGIPVEGGRCAGAPFETYAPSAIASTPAARWAVLDERLDRAAAEAQRLGEGGIERMVFIGENVGLVRDAIGQIAAGGGVGVARPRA